MSNTNSNPGFLAQIFHAVGEWFSTKAKPAIEEFTLIADNFVNAFKNFEESNAGQFIESVIETVIPQSTGLINAIKLELPQIALKLNWAVAEENKPDAEILADALKYLNNLKAVDPQLYAGQLNTLKSKIQLILSDNNLGGLSTQQSLAIAPVTHNPDKLTADN